MSKGWMLGLTQASGGAENGEDENENKQVCRYILRGVVGQQIAFIRDDHCLAQVFSTSMSLRAYSSEEISCQTGKYCQQGLLRRGERAPRNDMLK